MFLFKANERWARVASTSCDRRRLVLSTHLLSPPPRSTSDHLDQPADRLGGGSDAVQDDGVEARHGQVRDRPVQPPQRRHRPFWRLLSFPRLRRQRLRLVHPVLPHPRRQRRSRRDLPGASDQGLRGEGALRLQHHRLTTASSPLPVVVGVTDGAGAVLLRLLSSSMGARLWARSSYMHPRLHGVSPGRPPRVKCDITVFTETSAQVEMPPSEKLEQIGKLFETEEGANVAFAVGGEVFASHRVILANRHAVAGLQSEADGETKDSG